MNINELLIYPIINTNGLKVSDSFMKKINKPINVVSLSESEGNNYFRFRYRHGEDNKLFYSIFTINNIAYYVIHTVLNNEKYELKAILSDEEFNNIPSNEIVNKYFKIRKITDINSIMIKDDETNIYYVVNTDYQNDIFKININELNSQSLVNLITSRYHRNSYFQNLFNDIALSEDEIREMLIAKYPYSGVDVILNKSTHYVDLYLSMYIKYPFLEQLVKAGFDDMIIRSMNINDMQAGFKATFKNGKNLDEIIQMPKWLWKMLLTYSTLSCTDYSNWRILQKKYNISKESVETMMLLGINSSKNIRLFKNVMNQGYYTADKLISYLGRVDMYQAISPEDALQLIVDYCKMMKDMNLEPELNSNSLKREHDVACRNYKVALNDIQKENYKIRLPELQELAFEDSNYAIIVPQDLEDIIKEGKAMNNCVGSYCNSVSKGKSNIVFMRKKSDIEKSYITIEVNLDKTALNQKFLSSNRQITDPKDLKFIDKYVNYLREKNQSKAC